MAKKIALSPASVDALSKGKLDDLHTPGLTIEVRPNKRKCWRYRRRVSGKCVTISLVLGPYPAHSIADARTWASNLNKMVEAGIDPRDVQREEDARAAMTVQRAHDLYMEAVRDGRASRAKRKNKPRTVADKL